VSWDDTLIVSSFGRTDLRRWRCNKAARIGHFCKSATPAQPQDLSRVFLMKKMKPMIKTTTISIQVCTSMPKMLKD
jgi:hypothetical protein